MKIFLDDVREPFDCTYYILHPCYKVRDWTIVRTHLEFVALIEKLIAEDKFNEVTLISFDHDLSDEHYDETMYNSVQSATEGYNALYEKFKEKTGYECAKFLVNKVVEHKLKMPECLCHSMNPVGKQNILATITNYRKHFENEKD